MELGTILDVVTLGVVSVGGYLVSVAKGGIKTSVEESVKVAVKNANWARELAQELEKVRGTERQELRFKSYGCLWNKLRPLAIYDDKPLDQTSARELARELSDWYFSADGGLMLTAPVRQLYFALQDLLRATSAADVPPWRAERAEKPKEIFAALVTARGLAGAARVLESFDEKRPERALAAWSEQAQALATGWRDELDSLGEAWTTLTPRERFAAFQQAGSVLRTGMTWDVESRLR